MITVIFYILDDIIYSILILIVIIIYYYKIDLKLITFRWTMHSGKSVTKKLFGIATNFNLAWIMKYWKLSFWGESGKIFHLREAMSKKNNFISQYCMLGIQARTYILIYNNVHMFSFFLIRSTTGTEPGISSWQFWRYSKRGKIFPDSFAICTITKSYYFDNL